MLCFGVVCIYKALATSLIHDQLTLKLKGGVNFTVIDVTLVMIFVIITCKGVVIDYGMYRGAEPTIVPSVMVHRLSKKVLTLCPKIASLVLYCVFCTLIA